MVLLKSNFHEIRQFAELAWKDSVQVRFMLPMHDRNGQSIMTDKQAMEEAVEGLEAVAQEAWKRGQRHVAREILGEARVVKSRLERGVFRPIPDDDMDQGEAPPQNEQDHEKNIQPVEPDFAQRAKQLGSAKQLFGPKT